MQTIPYTDARNQLTRLMDGAVRDRKPIAITRNGASLVVMLAAEEYESMEETLHLLSTPANAECIRQGLTDYANGVFQSGELCD
jgi:antitoxin YefM